MIGSHSIFKNIIVANDANPLRSFEVLIQANKNHSICDVILPGCPEAPKLPRDTSDGDSVRAYNAAKREYQAAMGIYKAKRSYVLNLVQGQQIENVRALNKLHFACHTVLN